mgnify:CR=1 FL=1
MESATRSHEVRQEKEATILHKKAQEALLQKKLIASTQKNFILSSTAQHEVLQEKESTILQKKKATGLTQQSKDVAFHRNKLEHTRKLPMTIMVDCLKSFLCMQLEVDKRMAKAGMRPQASR